MLFVTFFLQEFYERIAKIGVKNPHIYRHITLGALWGGECGYMEA